MSFRDASLMVVDQGKAIEDAPRIQSPAIRGMLASITCVSFTCGPRRIRNVHVFILLNVM